MTKLLSAALALLITTSLAYADLIQKTVKFAPGATGTTVSDTITVDDSIDYTLHLKAGQMFEVSMTNDNRYANFNVLPPSSDEALFVGSQQGDQFAQRVEETGQYRVRAYLMRSARQHDPEGKVTLTMQVTGGDAASTNTMDSTKFADGSDYFRVEGLRAGDTLNLRSQPGTRSSVIDVMREGEIVRNLGCRDVSDGTWCSIELTDGSLQRGWAAARYLTHGNLPATTITRASSNEGATGQLPCAQYRGQPFNMCAFSVERAGARSDVTFAFPGGDSATLTFVAGELTSPREASVRKVQDLYMIEVGDQRFEVVEAAISGG